MIFEFDIPSCSRIVASTGCSGLGCGEGIGIVVEKDKISAVERG